MHMKSVISGILRKFKKQQDNARQSALNKTAFTLSEVLITLGIIGVVAAMTIPNLITEHQKRATVTKLQRAISVLNQAYRLSFEEIGEPDNYDTITSREYFDTYWAPYIKVLTYCSSYDICGYDSNAPFHWLNGKSTNGTWALVADYARTTFYTIDGFMYIVFTSYTWGTHLYDVLVDINGNSAPNRFGHDVFWLTRISDGGGIQPKGYDESDEYIKKYCVSGTSGINLGSGCTCAERIRRAGWKIEKDYPW